MFYKLFLYFITKTNYLSNVLRKHGSNQDEHNNILQDSSPKDLHQILYSKRHHQMDRITSYTYRELNHLVVD